MIMIEIFGNLPVCSQSKPTYYFGNLENKNFKRWCVNTTSKPQIWMLHKKVAYLVSNLYFEN